MLALETDRLTKDYAVGFWRRRPYRALDGLSLQVEAGEVFGLLGPNGAGKTTTLKLLMELIYPTSGRIAILGHPPGHPEVRRRAGFLPEAPYFYDYLTAEELLSYFAGLFGLRDGARRARVAALLDLVGIGGERRLALRKCSKGMLQRVGLAQALLNEPDLVFLDEPMSGLDPLGRRDVRAIVLGLRDRGCTVVFSSHILSDAEALCSRVGILVGGRLVAAGRLSDMLAFEVEGWELVMAGLDEAALGALGSRVRRATPLGGGRYAIELPPVDDPDCAVAGLRARGGRLVSLNPMRATLEDYFVRQVEARAGGPTAGRTVPER
ncbi:MAG TPA: ABC transporter ATP-binding protein [Vicinamibacterales bacterium]|nr:ABC transporter ATP-binding protein [Vicinamibacterales bacterium]HPK71893.1 ABC transporter ATP-binding protein [Vicinamibacterales bacterium]